GVLLNDPSFEGIDNFQTASALAKAIEKIGDYDLILMGRAAADWDMGVVPIGVANVLGIPFVTVAKAIEKDNGNIKVERVLDDGFQTVKAPLPAVVSVSNEFGDWDTVHHTFTYANAVDQAMRRAPSRELARAIFDGAMSVYLDRFLNVPKQAIPRPAAPASPDALLDAFDRQQQVDETAAIVASLLTEGRHDEVIALLGHALLREDAGFHQFQIYEAAVRQFHNFQRHPEGDEILIGAARFLTAHAPTVRATGQTYEIAARLHRGEALATE
ncbi:MAG: electron transfer flavoprotein subunit beta/FixA family protein, partial [Myxococcota bacterium]